MFNNALAIFVAVIATCYVITALGLALCESTWENGVVRGLLVVSTMPLVFFLPKRLAIWYRVRVLSQDPP